MAIRLANSKAVVQESTEEQKSFIAEGMGILQELTRALAKWKLEKLLSGPYDDRPAILTVQVDLLYFLHCPCPLASGFLQSL